MSVSLSIRITTSLSSVKQLFSVIMFLPLTLMEEINQISMSKKAVKNHNFLLRNQHRLTKVFPESLLWQAVLNSQNTPNKHCFDFVQNDVIQHTKKHKMKTQNNRLCADE